MQEATGAAKFPVNDNQIRAKDTERQRIEKNLQRQRMIAISGRTLRTNTDTVKTAEISPGRSLIHHDSSKVTPHTHVLEQNRPAPPAEKPTEQRTIIIGKRKTPPIKDQNFDTEDQSLEPVVREDLFISPGPDTDAPDADSDGMKVSVKDPSYRAKDDIFGGKSIVRTEVPQARDSGLIHTRLAQKKSMTGTVEENEGKTQEDPATGQSLTSEKKRKITTKNDDISWI
jgi:hypothetical protein